jgi:hypothetical protein
MEAIETDAALIAAFTNALLFGCFARMAAFALVILNVIGIVLTPALRPAPFRDPPLFPLTPLILLFWIAGEGDAVVFCEGREEFFSLGDALAIDFDGVLSVLLSF